MNNQKRLIIGGAVVIILAIILVVMISIKKSNPTPKVNNIIPPKETSVTASKIQNVIGEIISVDMETETVEIGISDGRKVNLRMLSTGTSFIKQTKQADGSLLNEKIGLLNIPKNQTVDIQYNSQTNELMMIVVN